MIKRWQKVVLAAGLTSIASGGLAFIRWKLTARPTAEPAAQLKSLLPPAVLVIGGLASVLFVLVAYLAQSASARKRELAEANRRLQLEMEVRQKIEREMERLIRELDDALAHVKTLSGLLPICARCKKIRDDKGYWSQIETYISQHSTAQFTHSLCPECAVKTLKEAGIEASASDFQSAGPLDKA
jgi:hypothetical protein